MLDIKGLVVCRKPPTLRLQDSLPSPAATPDQSGGEAVPQADQRVSERAASATPGPPASEPRAAASTIARLEVSAEGATVGSNAAGSVCSASVDEAVASGLAQDLLAKLPVSGIDNQRQRLLLLCGLLQVRNPCAKHLHKTDQQFNLGVANNSERQRCLHCSS